jgi:hypothetical protein
MSDRSSDKKSELRVMVAAVESAMADVTAEPVRDAWKRLVVGLDLGPEPATRACPHCGRLGMAQATRCGFCWNATTPVG